MFGWTALSSLSILTVDLGQVNPRLITKYSPSIGGVIPLGSDLSVLLSSRSRSELEVNEAIDNIKKNFVTSIFQKVHKYIDVMERYMTGMKMGILILLIIQILFLDCI